MTQPYDIYIFYFNQSVSNVCNNTQLWSSLVELSGGSLKSTKYFWYCIMWQLTNNVLKMNTQKQPTQSTPIDIKGKLHKINPILTNESLCILGLWKKPLGTMDTQFQYTTNKMIQLCHNLQTNSLHQNEIPLLINMYTTLALSYIFHGTNISQEQGAKLETILYPTLLNKLVFRHSTL